MKNLLFLLTFIPLIGISQNKKELISTVNRLKNDSANLQLQMKNVVYEKNKKINERSQRIKELYTNSLELKKTNKSNKNEIDILKIKVKELKYENDSLDFTIKALAKLNSNEEEFFSKTVIITQDKINCFLYNGKFDSKFNFSYYLGAFEDDWSDFEWEKNDFAFEGYIGNKLEKYASS